MTMAVGATGTDIRFSGNHTVAAKVDSQIYQVSDDFSRVWGRHQLGVGTSIQYRVLRRMGLRGSNATFTFNGTVTGLALADFLIGRMSSFGHSSPQINTNHQWYIGVYVAGRVESVGPCDAQSRTSLGPVHGDRVGERDHFQLLTRQLQRRTPEHEFPERAARAPLPG